MHCRASFSDKNVFNNLEVFDVSGKKIYADQITTSYKAIKTEVAKGIYFVKVSNENRNFVKKVFIK